VWVSVYVRMNSKGTVRRKPKGGKGVEMFMVMWERSTDGEHGRLHHQWKEQCLILAWKLFMNCRLCLFASVFWAHFTM